VFERFTDRARRVVVLSQEEARELGHNYIGTEHLLLGVIREGEGVGAQALAALEIDLGEVRSRVVELIGTGHDDEAGAHIPFTPRSKKVLELSLREALQLGHNYIGTEHILLGLLREGHGVAAQVLRQLGVDLNDLRGKVVELVQRPGPGAPEAFAQERFRPAEALTGAPVSARLDAIEKRLERIEELLLRLAAGPEPGAGPEPSDGAERRAGEGDDST
jgi:ATP-dependent Clp protease ATP-binding subunit ClpC